MMGLIEQIEAGHKEIQLPFGISLPENPDQLDINNGKPNAWIFSPLTGYRQLGTFKVKRPHNFNEGDLVELELNEKGRIVQVRKV